MPLKQVTYYCLYTLSAFSFIPGGVLSPAITGRGSCSGRTIGRGALLMLTVVGGFRMLFSDGLSILIAKRIDPRPVEICTVLCKSV